MCPPVPLPALLRGGNLYEQRGPKSWQQPCFRSPPWDSGKPTCWGLDLVLVTRAFVCLATRGRHTLSSPLVRDCESQPLLLPTETKQFFILFYFFCLDLSRPNTAAWDTRDKAESLFAFQCNVEMFSCWLKSWSSQMLQIHSGQQWRRWPGAHHPSCHHTNQRTKTLPTSLQQLRPKCKTSDNRWDQTDGGAEGKKEAILGSVTGRGLGTLTALLLSSLFVGITC